MRPIGWKFPKNESKVSAVIQLYSSLCPEIVDAYDLSIMKQAYYMNEKTFYNKDYRFMKVEFKDQKTVYSIEWKNLLTLLENPVISVLRL